ncbi:dolichyl-P-Man:Man(5)GlcNAc(2)-PP-dolichyl mannosyltransferase [Coprinopsis cinerea okayama7|uniref:Dol-P-Man:Man(5)GlcNAc(2)-PP-Dol alpha-1,3-mannosyltransferase n=1 Tax=Coprinopsis cinerea (strain Okayama-7 / 130 / ATCC MYA-4618 / FGSC 9003) TaxID=240176 RepID=D6RKR7_COPC7|nr:dolichyl-P-Man:Man(5)GlcNAc(2)-PP-dolichyl mannosyltransferase [Coprinopsis cinerea okayama7\|eukprot:XP_002911939.1 dolichyl-P-Man:Man(5)GlcNAc(2)-PP-dolichyl mannosyltransferase [Coprinopsis cinerea okayama7\
MSSTSWLPKPIASLLRFAYSLLTDPGHFWNLATLVILGDAFLTRLIVAYVPYTEIDWETYMVQTNVFLKGQHNYSMITGPTGPLVYPAGHVRIHQFLYEITDGGKNMDLAQQIYGLLYIASLSLACLIYGSTRAVPNWLLLFLPLSKRLHSIFVLRLFNDCWAVVLSQMAIYALQQGYDDTGVMLFSAALSVKMSVLLYFPGLFVILFKRKGLLRTLAYIMSIVAIQHIVAAPFLKVDAWAYLQNAFDLGRVFLYKWTVNWRIFDEETFLSSEFAASLLFGHVFVLCAFGLYRWCEIDGGVWTVITRGFKRPLLPAGIARVTPDYITTVLYTSNLIGIIFARSLHYQFYSWYAHSIPFLAWKTKYPIALRIAFIGAIEYAWNIYPSTRLSSGILLAANTWILLGLWHGHATCTA